MDMDAAGFIYPCSACTELPHKLLYGFDVPIFADGRDKLHRIIPSGRSIVSSPAADRSIADHLPLPVLGIPHGVGIVSTAHMGCIGSEVSGNNSRGSAPCQSGHLDFDTEVLASQSQSPSAQGVAPTAEEGAVFFFGLGEGLLPAFSSINSRTLAGTYLPYKPSAALTISSSKDRSFCPYTAWRRRASPRRRIQGLLFSSS